MNIGIVVQNEFPSDREVRPRKTAKVLDRRGQKVVIFAAHSDDKPSREAINYAVVRRFSWLCGTPLFRFVKTPMPLNFVWIAWLALTFIDEQLDVVITANIRVGFPGLVASQLAGQASILDLHENNPEALKLMPKRSVVHYITRSSKFVALLERVCIQLADEVWVVVVERRDELTSAGVPQSAVRVISNTPYLREHELAERRIHEREPLEDWDLPGSAFLLVYVGVITNYRGLERVVNALQELPEDSSVHFAIAGDGPYSEVLARLIEESGVNDRITLLGWIDAKQVPSFLNAGHVGVIPHDVTPFTNTTIPNKLFDYMAVGLPVLATDMQPVARIVEEVNCGTIVPADVSSSQLADEILAMEQSDARDIMGENGRQAVLSEYNWEQETGRIVESLESVTGEKLEIPRSDRINCDSEVS